MTRSRREDVAHQIVTVLPGFGTWAEAISEYSTPWGKVGFRQLELLWIIRHRLVPDEKITPKAIAAFFDVQPSVVTRLVAKLEQRGLLRRHEDPGDGRSFWLELTPDGVEVSRYVEQLHDREVLDTLDDLSDEQIDLLSESLPLLRHIGQTLLTRRKAQLRG